MRFCSRDQIHFQAQPKVHGLVCSQSHKQNSVPESGRATVSYLKGYLSVACLFYSRLMLIMWREDSSDALQAQKLCLKPLAFLTAPSCSYDCV